jgi:hypothetical protein
MRKSTRAAIVGVLTTIVAAGAIVMAQPAEASFSPCANNVCTTAP